MLALDAVVPLGNVRGRIDHLAVDARRQRLYVAELGNGSVSAIDLKSGRLLHRISGLDEPQGVAYAAEADAIFATTGGDGLVHRFDGESFRDRTTQRIGADADNIRVAPSGQAVLIGHGNGALVAIDSSRMNRVDDIALKGHPESFQPSADGKRVYVNVPTGHEVAVIDLTAGKQVAAWKTGEPGANFPMALTPGEGVLWVVLRSPARLVSFDARSGAKRQALPTCEDSDDVFIDARQRLYVICGSGEIDVYENAGGSARPVSRTPTRAGARTGLLVPSMNKLFVAARAEGSAPAAILVFRISDQPIGSSAN